MDPEYVFCNQLKKLAENQIEWFPRWKGSYPLCLYSTVLSCFGISSNEFRGVIFINRRCCRFCFQSTGCLEY